MDAPTNLCILITFKPVASCITIHQHLVHRFKKEILEIACLKVGTKSKQVEDSFRQYVRPKYCGRLNGVTMNITGVRQEMVSSAPRFRVAWMKFMNWYSAAKGNHSVAFLTVDSFPINMHLRCQTLLSKMRPSDDFNQWIVLKKGEGTKDSWAVLPTISSVSRSMRNEEKAMIGAFPASSLANGVKNGRRID
nr:PREDICTED: 3'-5' exoribonuclease 1-like isoform X3 [Bemisia tabaci]